MLDGVNKKIIDDLEEKIEIDTDDDFQDEEIGIEINDFENSKKIIINQKINF